MRLKDHLLEVTCCLLIVAVFIGTAFSSPIKTVWDSIQTNRKLSQELTNKTNEVEQLREVLNEMNRQQLDREFETNRIKENLEKSTTELSIAKQSVENLKELYIKRTIECPKSQTIITDRSDEVAYQVWKGNREARRRAARERWR